MREARLGSPAPPVRVLAVVGPTASGKSALAVGVAERLGGEIVSADSMQVYRGLDIGTAKPAPEETARVPHHLIDVAGPLDDFSVATYQALGRSAVAAINRRGRLPVLVGGTGLYVRALLYDYDFAAPGRDPAARAELEAAASAQGAAALHRRLQSIDPVAAARIHPNDLRRITRALEVWKATGRPISAAWGDLRPVMDALVVGLRLEREDLYRRIDARVEDMARRGLVAEVRRLVADGYTRALVSGQALGYKEIVAYLDGALTLPEALEQVKRATRNYAKRQMTWFRRERDVIWLDGPGCDKGPLVERVAGLAAAKWGEW